ncbi:hypothetical protein E2C01_020459 [Portunus trituberculatus]|uniref:Uncharacterized protein n=1 Tax=Portunus trituberculatus TaxID=210409 RepID=A0A5B7DZX5_PORTR|nr:hypothetical protein [Portunus trituberculatus]
MYSTDLFSLPLPVRRPFRLSVMRLPACPVLSVWSACVGLVLVLPPRAFPAWSSNLPVPEPCSQIARL